MSNKCAGGVELPKRGPCPECGNGPAEGCAKANAAHQTEVESLRAKLAIARKALQFIADGYENHDINHVDYRVTVYQVATDALKDLP